MKIEQFKPQKVLHLKDALSLKNPKIYGDYVVSEKYEGWDTTIYFDGKAFHNPLSSAGREIPAFEWVGEALSRKQIYSAPFVLKAEAYLFDTPFQILNGIFNRSVGNYWCRDVVFMVHDFIPLDEYTISAERRAMLRDNLLDHMESRLLRKARELYKGEYDKTLWNELFMEVADNGGEGIVAKRLASPYSPGKRNADILKLKLECTRECLVDRVEVGKGEKGNTSYTIVSKRRNGTEIRTVMSRLSDIAEYLRDPSYIVGKVIQVKAMEEYPDGQLRQPVFQFIRYDKTPEEID